MMRLCPAIRRRDMAAEFEEWAERVDGLRAAIAKAGSVP